LGWSVAIGDPRGLRMRKDVIMRESQGEGDRRSLRLRFNQNGEKVSTMRQMKLSSSADTQPGHAVAEQATRSSRRPWLNQ
jgi:hypothetical protein